ncbi:MAG: hypothetical protein K0S65_1773 [Labilithrix sp.]|nr:hypothetical protein [Labilithrix sp.]
MVKAGAERPLDFLLYDADNHRATRNDQVGIRSELALLSQSGPC